jgi:Lar family restriction alleviation protein
MSEELKSCPFCGGKSEIEFDDEPCYHGSTGWYYAKCKVCRAKGSFKNTEKEAANAWNTRLTSYIGG